MGSRVYVYLRNAGAAQGVERRLSRFLGTDDTILYSSCFDANGGYLKPAGAEDAVIPTS
jgi:7-keto-8-aminopelargonate synthetase-like enzyme